MRKHSKVVKNMYKNVNIVLAFIAILLTGCSNFSIADDADSEETVVDTREEAIDEITESKGIKGDNDLPMVQPSDQLEDIVFDGEVKNLQGAVAGREHIFLYGRTESEEHSIYIIKTGEVTEAESEVKWDENNKRVCCMTTDETGNCYVLMMSVTEDFFDYKTTEVVVVDTDGKVVGTIDISDQMEELDWEFVPDGISVDKEGNIYFFSEADKYSVTVVNPDGEILGCLNRKSEWYIEGIGRGKDGAVYIVYSNAGECSIGKVEANGEVTKTYENVLPKAFGKYKYIFPGTDSNLLIYGRSDIYTYTDGAEAEERVAKEDLSFDMDAKVFGFLADGRLVVSYRDDEGMSHFLYVPTVK